MTRPLRVGIVGCGGIAKAHKGGYEALGNVDIAAVYDVSNDAAETFAASCNAQVATVPDDLITKHSVDAVSICSPPGAHVENCLPFVEAGIPVLCEKPLATNRSSALRLAKAVLKKGSVFMTAYCHRYHPPVIEMKRIIDEGTLGDPVMYRNIFSGPFKLENNHRADPELSGGGCVADNSSHSTDLFRFLVGNPTHVQAMTANVQQQVRVEDIGVIHFSLDDRVFAEIASCYSVKFGPSIIAWHGTQGSIVLDYSDADEPLKYMTDRKAGWVPVDCSGRPNRFAAEIAHFVDCVRDGKNPSPSVEDGLKANQVIAAVYESAAQGRRMEVDYTMNG